MTGLVVLRDDRLTIRIRAALVAHGVASAPARSAGEAWDMAGGEAVRLLVTSVGLEYRDDGLALARAMSQRWRTSVVILAGLVSRQAVREAAALPHASLVGLPADPLQLDLALRLAIARASLCAASDRPSTTADVTPWPALDDLPQRQRDIARLLLDHHRVPAIARQLGISPPTVRNHLKAMFRYAGVGSQQDLLYWLRARGEDDAHFGHRDAPDGVDYPAVFGRSACDVAAPHGEAEGI